MFRTGSSQYDQIAVAEWNVNGHKGEKKVEPIYRQGFSHIQRLRQEADEDVEHGTSN